MAGSDDLYEGLTEKPCHEGKVDSTTDKVEKGIWVRGPPADGAVGGERSQI